MLLFLSSTRIFFSLIELDETENLQQGKRYELEIRAEQLLSGRHGALETGISPNLSIFISCISIPCHLGRFLRSSLSLAEPTMKMKVTHELGKV